MTPFQSLAYSLVLFWPAAFSPQDNVPKEKKTVLVQVLTVLFRRPEDSGVLLIDTLFRFPKFKITQSSHEHKISGHDIIFTDLKANQPVTYVVTYDF